MYQCVLYVHIYMYTCILSKKKIRLKLKKFYNIFFGNNTSILSWSKNREVQYN